MLLGRKLGKKRTDKSRTKGAKTKGQKKGAHNKEGVDLKSLTEIASSLRLSIRHVLKTSANSDIRYVWYQSSRNDCNGPIDRFLYPDDC